MNNSLIFGWLSMNFNEFLEICETTLNNQINFNKCWWISTIFCESFTTLGRRTIQCISTNFDEFQCLLGVPFWGPVWGVMNKFNELQRVSMTFHDFCKFNETLSRLAVMSNPIKLNDFRRNSTIFTTHQFWGGDAQCNELWLWWTSMTFNVFL